MSWQVPVRIGNLPFYVMFLSDGSVSIIPFGGHPAILELDKPVNGWFFHDEFWMIPKSYDMGFDNLFSYNVAYHLDHYPLLKRWLIQQELTYPEFKET